MMQAFFFFPPLPPPFRPPSGWGFSTARIASSNTFCYANRRQRASDLFFILSLVIREAGEG